MDVKINISYPHLLQYTGNRDAVRVTGDTVGGCLEDLVRQYPGIKKSLYDEQGRLLNYIMFFINREYASPVALDKPLKDGDELTIALMIAGG